jgi:hypothetical protein
MSTFFYSHFMNKPRSIDFLEKTFHHFYQLRIFPNEGSNPVKLVGWTVAHGSSGAGAGSCLDHHPSAKRNRRLVPPAGRRAAHRARRITHPARAGE